MKKKESIGKRISALLSTLVLIFAFIGNLFSTTNLAILNVNAKETGSDTHELSLKLVKVDTDEYDLSDSSNYYDIYSAYYDGELTAIDPSKDKLEPGATYMYLIHYTPGNSKTVTSMNVDFFLDKGMWTPITAVIDDDTGEEGLYAELGDDLPTYVQKKQTLTGWEVLSNFVYSTDEATSNSNYDTVSSYIADTQKFMALEDEMDLCYFFLTLNSNATGNATYTWDTDPNNFSASDEDSIDVPMKGVNLSIPVAGSGSTPTTSSDATLSKLTLSESLSGTSYTYALNPTFSSGSSTTSYSVYVRPDVTSIDFDVTTSDKKGTVSSTSATAATHKLSFTKSNLGYGNNTEIISVTSSDGTQNTITVNIYRLSDDTSLSSSTPIALTDNDTSKNISLTQSGTTFSATVKYAVKNTTIKVTPNSTKTSSISGDGTWILSNISPQNNTKTVTVYAENCNSNYSNVPGNTCAQNSYTINVTRQAASTDNTLSDIKINGTSVGSTFNPSGSYDTTNPFKLSDVSGSTSSITVTPVTNDSTATILTTSPYASDTGTVNLTDGDNYIHIYVQAEDPNTTPKEYVLYVYKESDDADLASLNVTPDVASTPAKTIQPPFQSSNQGTYTFTYDSKASQFTVTATANNSKAKVIIYDSSKTPSSSGTSNTDTATFTTSTSKISIQVTPEDGSTTKIYTLELKRETSTDKTIGNLDITYGSTPTYATWSYDTTDPTKILVTIPNDISEVTVNATPNSKYATITSGNGTYSNLTFGENNPITLIVTDEANDTQKYTIVITRELSNDSLLNNIEITDTSKYQLPNFNSTTYDYTSNKITEPRSTTSITVDYTKANDNETVTMIVEDEKGNITTVSNGTVPLAVGDNKVSITVVSQDKKSTSTYKFIVTRTKNTDATIKDVKVKGVSATLQSDGTYSVTLPNSVTTVNPSDVTYTLPDGATDTKTQTLQLTNTATPYQYTFDVQPEDTTKSKTTYTINITRSKSNDTTVSKITVTDTSGKTYTCTPDSNLYCEVEVPDTTTTFTVDATIPDGATVVPANGTSNTLASTDTDTTITLSVTPESGTTTVPYTIKVKKSSTTTTIDPATHQLEMKLVRVNTNQYKFSTDSDYDDFVDDYVNGKLNSYELNSSSQLQPGELYMFAMHYTPGTNKDIVAMNVDLYLNSKMWTPIYESGSLSTDMLVIDGYDYPTYPYKKDLITGWSTLGNFVDPYPTSSNTSLVSFYISDDVKFLPLPSEMDLVYYFLKLNSDATGTATLTWATDSNDFYASDENSINVPMVGKNAAYKISSTAVTYKKDSSLASLSVTNGNDTYGLSPAFVSPSTTTSYKVIVPNSVNNVTISATTNDSNAIIMTGSDTGNQTVSNVGKNTYTISVQDDYGTVVPYTIEVYKLNNDTSLSNDITLTNTNISLTKSSNTYSGSTTYATSSTNINVTPTDSNAFLEMNGSTATSPIPWTLTSSGTTPNTATVTVNAENCQPQYLNNSDIPGNTCDSAPYTINVTRTSPSSNADLNSLTATYNSSSTNQISNFSSTTYQYTLPAVTVATKTVNIKATLADSTAQILYDSANNQYSNTGSQTLNVGNNAFYVYVKAEDGTVKQYEIDVYQKSNDSSLYNLNVQSNPQGSFNSPFSSTNLQYGYNYDSSVTTVTVNAYPTDNNAKILMYDNTADGSKLSSTNATQGVTSKSFPSGTSKIYVRVYAEDDTYTDYEITLTQSKSTDATLSSLIVADTTTKNQITILDGNNNTFSPSSLTYSATVATTVSSVDVSTITNNTKAQVKSMILVNGNTNASSLISTNKSSSTVPLQIGLNIIQVNVQAEDTSSTKTYEIYLTRQASSVATLNDIQIDGTTITGLESNGNIKTFTSNDFEYTIPTTVPYSTKQITLTYTLTDSNSTASITKPTGVTNGKISLATGVNDIEITVTAQDKSTSNTYKVHVTRSYNTDDSISNLKVKGVTATRQSDGVYTVTLPYSTTVLNPSDITLTLPDGATLIDNNSNVQLSTKNSTPYQFAVSSEDATINSGTPKNYTINVTREKNNDTSIISVKATTGGTDYIASKDSSGNYKIFVPAGTTSFVLSATLADGATIISPQSNNTSYNLTTNPMQIQLIVQAEDGSTTAPYTVTVEAATSGNADLASLAVTSTDGTNTPYDFDNNQTFSPSNVMYYVTVPYDVEDVNIVAAVSDSTATITPALTNPYKLAFGSNSYQVTVQPNSGGTPKTYYVYVTREYNDDATLSDLNVTSADGTTPYALDRKFEKTDNGEYVVTVPNSVDKVSINATATDTTYATISGDGVQSLNTGDNKFTITVTAQKPGVTNKYTINIKRTLSSDTSVDGIVLDGNVATYNAATGHWEVTVPYETTQATNSNLVVTPHDKNAQPIFGGPMELSTKNVVTLPIIILAEDSTNQTIQLDVTRTKDNKKDITKIVLTPYDSNSNMTTAKPQTRIFEDDGTVEIDVPADTTNFKIATTIPQTATVTAIADNETTSQDPNYSTYTFKSNETKRVVTITCTAENGDTQIYTVTVNRQNSSNNNLSDLKVTSDDKNTIYPFNDNVTFNPTDTGVYYVTVGKEVEKVRIDATVEDTDKSTIVTDLSNAFTVVPGQNDPIPVVVKAQNGNSKTYYVVVIRTKNNDVTLQSLKIDGESGTDISTFQSGSSITKYKVDVENNVTKIDLYALPTDKDNATIDKNELGEKTLSTGINTFNFTVTAADGTTKQKYEIEVNRKKSDDSTITDITLAGVQATLQSDGTYTVTVPNSVDEANSNNLIVTPTDSNATVSFQDTNLTTTTSTTSPTKIQITVTPESSDSTKATTYTLFVTRTPDNSNELTAITLTPDTGSTKSTIFDNNKEASFEVAEDVTSFTLSTSIPATTKVTDTAGNDINNPSTSYTFDTNPKQIVLTCTAEDGTFNTYTVTVTRQKSSNNKLADLTVKSTDGTKTYPFSDGTKFDPDNIGIYYVVVEENTTSVMIEAKPQGNATIETNLSQPFTVNPGVNDKIEIQVKSENGNINKYFVVITRPLSSDVTLQNLTIDGSTGTKVNNFTSTTISYDITVDYNTNQIDLYALPTNDPYATIDKNELGIKQLNTGKNTFEFTVTAADGTTKQKYTVNVTREKNDDASITGITLAGVQATLQSDGTYTVTVPNEVEEANKTNLVVTPTDSNAKVSFNKTQLSTSTPTTVTIKVTPENNETKDEKEYDLIVTRSPDSTKDLTVITLTPDTGNKKTTVFDENKEATFEVAEDVTSFTLSTSIPATTKVTDTAGNDINNPSTSYTFDTNPKQLVLTSTAEDGTFNTYTVTVTRQKSSNNKLADLTVKSTDGTKTYPFSDGTKFDPDNIGIYYVVVEENTTSVMIEAKPQGNATIETNLSQPFTVNPGVNDKIEIQVKSENGNINKYFVVITRPLSSDVTLQNLTIDGSTGTQVTNFKPQTISYDITVGYSTNQINLYALPTDKDNATIDPNELGIKQLNTGKNTFKFTVTAADGTTKQEYTVNVTREKNDDASITGITLATIDATLQPDGTYTVTVPNDVDEANINNLVVTPTDSNAKVSFKTTKLSTTSPTTVTITVTPENKNKDDEKEYDLIVTREKNTISTLSSLTVSDGAYKPSFVPNSENDTEYTVKVPVDATDLTISATPTNENATISGDIGKVTLSTNPQDIEIKVTAEAGDPYVTIYKLHIEREKSTEDSLSDITVTSKVNNTTANYPLTPSFAKDTTSYTVNVPGDIESVEVEATLTDSRSTFDTANPDNCPGTVKLNVGENTKIIKVLSESGGSQTYTIKIIRAKKSNNNLTAITIDGVDIPNFDPAITEYTITPAYPYSKDSVDIGYTTSDTDATVIGDIGNNIPLSTGTQAKKITVTAQDGTVKTYTINITREKNDDATLKELKVGTYDLTPEFVPSDANSLDYTIKVPKTVDKITSSDITATPTDNNAKVVPDRTLNIISSGTNEYKIEVTAEDGTTTLTYTITVEREKSSDATLKEVSLTDSSISPAFKPDELNYTITLPDGDTNPSFSIIGTPTDATTQITKGNGSHTLSEGTFTIETLAEDGSTLTYTFTIKQADSTDATLSELSVTDYPFTKEYNSSTEHYSLKDDVIIGTTELEVIAKPNNVNATIEYYLEGVKQDSNVITLPQEIGTKTIKVVVTASTETKEYTIDYTMTNSTNAYLSKIEPSIGSLDKSFDKTETLYNIEVDGTVSSIDFDLETDDPTATMVIDKQTYNSPITYTFDNLHVGNNVLRIEVHAPSPNENTINTYFIIVNKKEDNSSDNVYLKELSIEDYPLTPEFDKDTEDYSIGDIPYSLDKVKITAIPEDSNASIYYYLNGKKQKVTDNELTLPIKEGTGYITVQVEAPNGDTKDYSVEYTKKASSNNYVSDIIVTSGEDDTLITYDLSPKYDKDTEDYKVTVGKDIDKVNITVTPEDDKATITINGTAYDPTTSYELTPLVDGDNNVTIVITSENGTPKTYTINVERKETTENDIPDKITSLIYGHTVTDDYILTVKLNATGSDLKDQLDNDNQYLVITKKDDTTEVSDTSIMATGYIVKLIINGEEKDRKVVVIKGDATGDGKINTRDASTLSNYTLEKGTLEGPYFEAADLNNDGKVNTRDASTLSNHILEKKLLY